MTPEDDVAAAAYRARKKAHREEIKAALEAATEIARKARESAERERIERYHHGTWGQVAFVLILGVLALLYVERQRIEQQASNCFDGPKRPYNYDCEDIVARSFWAWLLPADMAEALHVAQRAFHRQ